MGLCCKTIRELKTLWRFSVYKFSLCLKQDLFTVLLEAAVIFLVFTNTHSLICYIGWKEIKPMSNGGNEMMLKTLYSCANDDGGGVFYIQAFVGTSKGRKWCK